MRRRITNAALIAICVSLVVLFLTRTISHLPLIAGVVTFFVSWVALIPSRKGRKQVADTDEDRAIAELDRAATELGALAQKAPLPDRPLFRRLAELMGQIRDRHRMNPDHVRLTAKFRRHVVGRMVGSVESYVELARRSGRDQKARLAAISTQLEEFVPVLEKIDRACLENDLTALEINVEVLNEQLNRRGEGR